MTTWNAVNYNLLKQSIIQGGRNSQLADCILSNLISLYPDPNLLNNKDPKVITLFENCGSGSLNAVSVPFNTIIPTSWNSDIENQFQSVLYLNDPVPTSDQVNCALNFLKKYSDPNDAILFLVQDAIKNPNGQISILKCPSSTKKILIIGGIAIGIVLIVLLIVLLIKNRK